MFWPLSNGTRVVQCRTAPNLSLDFDYHVNNLTWDSAVLESHNLVNDISTGWTRECRQLRKTTASHNSDRVRTSNSELVLLSDLSRFLWMCKSSHLPTRIAWLHHRKGISFPFYSASKARRHMLACTEHAPAPTHPVLRSCYKCPRIMSPPYLCLLMEHVMHDSRVFRCC